MHVALSHEALELINMYSSWAFSVGDLIINALFYIVVWEDLVTVMNYLSY